eukprot:8184804-Karenia_brevis.AAC.1
MLGKKQRPQTNAAHPRACRQPAADMPRKCSGGLPPACPACTACPSSPDRMKTSFGVSPTR